MAASTGVEKLRVGYLRNLKQDRCSIPILMGSSWNTLKVKEKQWTPQNCFQKDKYSWDMPQGSIQIGITETLITDKIKFYIRMKVYTFVRIFEGHFCAPNSSGIIT